MPGNILTCPCRFVFARYIVLHIHVHMDPPPHLRRPMLVFSAHLRGRTPVFFTHLRGPMHVFSAHTKVIGSARRKARWLRAERGPLAPRTSRVALLGLSGLNPKGESFTTLFIFGLARENLRQDGHQPQVSLQSRSQARSLPPAKEASGNETGTLRPAA